MSSSGLIPKAALMVSKPSPRAGMHAASEYVIYEKELKA